MANGSLNKVQLIGNLGTDPEVKHFDNGGSLARFPIATSESYTNKANEKVELTEWHTIIARGGLVDVVSKYLKKGDKVYIEGRIRSRSWQDPASKETRYATEIVTDNLIMLGSRAAGPNDQSNSTPAKPQSYGESNLSSATLNIAAEQSQDEDDLPF
ncbi:MAG: single-stranded DNA-binding protein [Bacteroidetes bacterium]|nr:MAG: single-stranded DNA-binding protein [Bacteroidota bacterium]